MKLEKEWVFVVGDIHGDLASFETLLNYYEPSLHQLVLIGDLLDRGARGKECLLLGQKLVEESQAIYLKGNHEDMLVRFIANPEERYPNYLLNGGKATIDSLLHKGATEEYSPTEISLMIQSRYKRLLNFLEELPLYYEWGPYIFVHAGVNLELANWHNSSEKDFLWTREPFHNGKNQTGKMIVFGHTPTTYLNEDPTSSHLWLSDNKVGIDGGGIYGGSIHAVIFSKEDIIQDIELKNTEVWEPDV